MSIKELIKNNELNKMDIVTWLMDYIEVKEYIQPLLDKVKDLAVDDQVDYLIAKLHHNNAYNICSDLTTEPIEYIDFNYGSITCTVSFYERNVGELLLDIDGYIRRNNVELEGCYCSMNIKEIKELITEHLQESEV